MSALLAIAGILLIAILIGVALWLPADLRHRDEDPPPPPPRSNVLVRRRPDLYDQALEEHPGHLKGA